MAWSYALTTVAAVLLVELLIGATVWAFVTQSPVAEQGLAAGARQVADYYALGAAAQAEPSALDPRTTFEPGQPFSLPQPLGDWSNWGGPVDPSQQSSAGSDAVFALVVAPDGRVLASNYPERLPVGADFDQLLPSHSQLVRDALAGASGNTVERREDSRQAAAAATIWNKSRQPIGAVFVQMVEPTGIVFLGGIGSVILASAVLWLLFTLPVGWVFGLLTTRGLVRRIRRLAAATQRFAGGDEGQRVPVSGSDEVGQLEENFNQMAEQLAESADQRARLIEQQARQEERARIEQELSTAREIQQSLLPKEVPGVPGWRFTPYYQPATAVGGDFYDFLALEDGCWGVVVGDATGKGVPAALVMATARTMLRTAAQSTASPSKALERVNELLASEITPGVFVTCFFAVLDPATGRIRYANAGHEPPLRHRPGFAAELRATGMPLGMLPGTRYDEAEYTLASGEYLLFFTDGLVEAHNGAGEMFGFPRLEGLLAARDDEGSPLDAVLGEFRKHVGSDCEQEDDVTLVVLQRLDEAPSSAVGRQPIALAAGDGHLSEGSRRAA